MPTTTYTTVTVQTIIEGHVARTLLNATEQLRSITARMAYESAQIVPALNAGNRPEMVTAQTLTGVIAAQAEWSMALTMARVLDPEVVQTIVSSTDMVLVQVTEG